MLPQHEGTSDSERQVACVMGNEDRNQTAYSDLLPPLYCALHSGPSLFTAYSGSGQMTITLSCTSSPFRGSIRMKSTIPIAQTSKYTPYTFYSLERDLPDITQ